MGRTMVKAGAAATYLLYVVVSAVVMVTTKPAN